MPTIPLVTLPDGREIVAVSETAEELLVRVTSMNLDREDQARLDQLLELSPEVPVLYALLHAFLLIVRERKQALLRPWMQEATRSGIAELKSFVAGIERDYDAVYAALHHPWNQGQTEGFVNKLKTVKRMCFGRAGCALLRQRLLHAG